MIKNTDTRMDKAICAVMVTFNRLEFLKTALDHFFAQTVQPTSLIIVDNNSSDGTKQYLESMAPNSNLHRLYLPGNVGNAGGLATGINYALSNLEFDYFWILEDDTFYDRSTLQELVENLESSSFDMLGLSGFNIKFGTVKKLHIENKIQPVDFVVLDGTLIKADVVRKIGVPNERYFLMCEDYEYCLRLKKNGYKVGILNIGTGNYLHLGGSGKFTHATLWRGYYHSRNHMLILKKYFSVMNLLGYIYRQSKFIIGAGVLAPDRFKRMKLRLTGIWHGIKGIDGKTLDPTTLKFIKKEKSVGV